ADNHGWTVNPDAVYEDDGVSGAEFDRRPGLMNLLSALDGRKKPPFDVLIVSEGSRLGREMAETLYITKRMAQRGVRVFTYLHGRERVLDTPQDKLLLAVESFADEIERERARQRVTDSRQRKIKSGHGVGMPAYGYRSKVVTNADGQHSHVARVVYEPEA